MRFYASFALLLVLRAVARLLFDFDSRWIGDTPPEKRWRDVRLVALLHHTSLYEPIFAGVVPTHFLARISRVATVPIAKKTMDRPLLGRFFRLVAGNVVPVTRKRDETWREVLEALRADEASDSLIILLPEGRMMRADGLDSNDRPMTVRGGIADLILGTPEGQFLIAYSGGLHHVQVPGERFPRLGKTLHIDFEQLDIARYREQLLSQVQEGESFRGVVIRDLERRRDAHCPMDRAPGATPRIAIEQRQTAASPGPAPEERTP
jgi:1-acyl-sn-glycerol-3-phosphate acyltransferase